ncbi:phosphate uptake regulator PhoU [Rhodococcus triatomae]|nr:phosphate uptake regulator PhoU [Rhodococcus triatomae]QNG17891.1 phosphate uptake regulator PhoU [Rhodococcus triatomae]QNG22441.1 phosphate uptake regulator PhoU [Rhodococcus triatomae]
MRTRLDENMERLSGELAQMCAASETAMSDATEALLDVSLAAAERAIGSTDELDRAAAEWERSAFSLLALQSPVAYDLRFVVGGLRVVADVQRMGGLAVHVAKITRLRHPDHVVPEVVRDLFTRMGEVADRQAAESVETLRQLDPERAEALLHGDEAMDELHAELLATAQSEEWRYGVQAAVDLTLLGRFYERFCDHTVEIGRRVIWIETGVAPS